MYSTTGAGAASFQDKVTDPLADGVASACPEICCSGVEELPVHASAHTFHNRALKIDQDHAS